MPSSGSGTGTPVSSGVSPTTYPDAWPNCAVSLARYAAIIGYDECAFWGVTYTGQTQFECTQFWSEWQRQSVADALAQAQGLLEDVIGYPLCPTWITGTLADDGDARFVDQQAAVGNPIVTRWTHLIAAGVRATSTIRASASIDYSDADTAIVGPIATTVTDTDEVKVYYPSSSRVITPSRVTISGGNLTIQIPRCRLVAPDLLDNTGDPNVGLEKTTTSNFLSAVDVIRVYNDASTNATLVRCHACDVLCSANGCSQASDAACMVVKDPVNGIVTVHPATYANSAWTQYNSCYSYEHVRLNYLAGSQRITRQAENAIVRLAHSLMPEEPCGCSVTQRLWARDRKTSDVLSREMLNCPFGYSAGALFAYAWATGQMEVGRGGVA